MDDRYYDDRRQSSQSGYYPPPPHGQHHGGSSGSIDRGYGSQQYLPPVQSQYPSSSNMHLAPYEGDYRPSSSHSEKRHRHHHHHGDRSRSRNSRRSRKSSPSGDERSRSGSRTRDKLKAHKKEIGASLLGAAAGGALGHELGGGGIATILGVAAGAFAGDKLEKAREKYESHKKGERTNSDRKDRDREYEEETVYRTDKYGSSQRDLIPYDSDGEERRRHHHRHHHRSRSGRNRKDSDSSD